MTTLVLELRIKPLEICVALQKSSTVNNTFKSVNKLNKHNNKARLPHTAGDFFDHETVSIVVIVLNVQNPLV